MKKAILILIFIMIFLCSSVAPVRAADITAPDVPPSGEEVFPENPTSFSEGLMDILSDAEHFIQPAFWECLQYCVRILAVTILCAVCSGISQTARASVSFAAALSIAVMMLTPANNLIFLGRDTIRELTDYGKLLLPVMATAMAAQGAVSSSAALYTGTACLNAILGSVVNTLLIPMIYIYLLLSAVCCVVEEELLKKAKSFIKWALTWGLKITLYIFTGYMGITGVISGTVDASSIKAAKITISGVVPVVGGIISDASEAILLSAGIMKNSAGIYGILALISILIGPFVKIGAQYLTLKITGALCQTFSSKQCTQLVQDFSGAMGLVLAMTGTACLLQLVSTVCFMRGVGI